MVRVFPTTERGLAGSVTAFLALLVVLAAFSSVADSAMEVDEQRRFADGLFSRGLYDMAVCEYLSIAEGSPDYEDLDVVLFRLGESYRRLGDLPSAEKYFVRLRKECPRSPYRFKTQFRQAELHMASESYDEASRMLRDLLKARPPAEIAAAARYNLGYAQSRSGDSSGAAKTLRTVMASYPDSDFVSYACLELARLYGEQEKREEADALYLKAAEHPATPRVGAEAWFQWAENAFRGEDYERSARGYENLLEKYPADLRVAEAGLQAAWSYYYTEQPEDALELAQKAVNVKRRKDGDRWLYLKANCERAMKKDESFETYQQLVEAYPESKLIDVARYEQALMVFRSGDYRGAVEIARHLESPPRELRGEIDWLLAESYEKLGARADAEQYYRRVLDGASEGARTPDATYRLARLLREEGELEEAARLYDEFMAEYPEHALAPHALFEWASCMLQADKTEEAARLWAKVSTDYAEHAVAEEALYQEAMAHVRMEADAEAARTLAVLLDRHPETWHAVQAAYWMGVLADRGGHAKQAEEHLRHALKLEPDQEWEGRIKYRLASVLQKLGELGEAAELLHGLLDASTGTDMPPELLEWLARYQLEQEAYEHAVTAARMLVRMGSAPAWKQIGWSLVGKAQADAGSPEKAREAFREALSQRADTREGAESALALGFLALDQDDMEAAVTLFEEAAQRSVGEDFVDIRARSYYGLGRAAEGRDDADAAVRYYLSVGVLFDNEDLVPECLAHAAKLLGECGRFDEQAKTLKELSERYPESPWTRDRIESDN